MKASLLLIAGIFVSIVLSAENELKNDAVVENEETSDQKNANEDRLAEVVESAFEEWEFRESVDDFTDETISIASVMTKEGSNVFSLFVNCRNNKSLNVGITGNYINPTEYQFRMRFDSYKPENLRFSEQNDVLFLDARQRGKQIFVKKLASASRLLIRFPQFRRPVDLDFPLSGAKESLISLANKCKTKIAAGSAKFRDNDGKKYGSFVDMLEDVTWVDRYSAWNKNTEED